MIEAAGGVVLRDGRRGPEVLVVHRPRYDDWSLPKGKLDDGEAAFETAVREVAEETGVEATIGTELPPITYQVAGGTKQVRWYVMQPVHGDPADRPSNQEVDVARWVDVREALQLLSYARERDVLMSALAPDGAPIPGTPPVGGAAT